MADYPDEITLEEGSEELKFLSEHSELINTLAEIETPLKLTADTLFPNDAEEVKEEKWHNFVDLFFPEMGVRKFFTVKNGKVVIAPGRGSENAVTSLLDFFMVDEPNTMLNFARIQAQKQINAPLSVEPRGQGIIEPGVGARAFASRQEQLRGNQEYVGPEWPNNNNYNNNNYNENNNNRTKVGYTEEEEEMLSKLKGHAASKYYPNERRKSNRRRRNMTRRNSSLRRASRKNRKATRRANRK